MINNLNKNENQLNDSIMNEKKIINIINSLSIEDIISYISNDIVNILIENKEKTIFKINEIEDPLYSNKVPIIKIEDYFNRLVKFSKMEKSTLLLTFIYIKRFIEKEKYIIAFNNIFRLIISCSILAIKFNEKRAFKNSFYAKIAGLELEDLNNLEYNVFYRLDFNLRVLDNDFYNLLLSIYKEDSNNN